MKNWTTIIGILFLFAGQARGQSEWEVFSSISEIYELDTYQNKAYAATNAGLWIINLETGQDTLLDSTNSGLLGPTVKELEITETGSIWLAAGPNKTLYQYKDESISFVPIDTETIIYENTFDLNYQNDRLWFHLRTQPCTYEAGKFYAHSELYNRYRFQFNSQGELHYERNETLYKYVNEEVSEWNTLPEPGIDQIVYKYLIDKNDNHYFSVLQKDSTNFIVQKYFNDKWFTYPINEKIENFYELSTGDIAFEGRDLIGTISGNTFKIDSLKNRYSSLYDTWDFISLVHIDLDGTEWLSVSKGNFSKSLVRIHQQDTTTYSRSQSEISFSYLSNAFLDCDQTLYINRNTEVRKLKDSIWSKIPLTSFNDNCRSLTTTINPYTCEIWAYPRDRFGCLSLFKLEGDNFKEYDVLSTGDCDAMLFDEEGNIYMDCDERLLKINSVGLIKFYQNSGSISNLNYTNDKLRFRMYVNGNYSWHYLEGDNIIYDELLNNSIPVTTSFMLQDSKGYMWYSAYGSIYRSNGEEVEKFSLYADVVSMVEDQHNNYWLMMDNKGLAYWDFDKLKYYKVSDSGLYSDEGGSLLLQDSTTLWIHQQKGLTKMRIDEMTFHEPDSTEIADIINLSLYPNPTRGEFTLRFPHAEKRKIEIFNINGELIYSTETELKNLEVSSLMSNVLEAGCYWVKASGALGIAVEKVVVY